MENLKLFNRIRVVAQQVKNDGFRREYQNIIGPILEKYRLKICSDDEMYYPVREAIRKIHHLAVTYQYIPNHVACNRETITFRPDFSDHSTLLELEKLTMQYT